MVGQPWQRHVHAESVWGTVVTFDIRGAQIDDAQVRAACRAAAAELHRIDEWLSPFRTDSAISRVRAGLAVAEAPEPVGAVLAACAELSDRTNGAFDVWRQPGGVDPCGYVKGWGADRAAAILIDHGFVNASVNAAGDVTCRGESGPGVGGWRIGVADPRDRRQVLAQVMVRGAHLATSGRAEQGDHVLDPRTMQPVTGIDSATVLANVGGTADALATALLVLGPAGLATVADLSICAMVVSAGRLWTIGQGWELASATG